MCGIVFILLNAPAAATAE